MRRGLSLLETIVSMFLFLLIVILVFNLYPSSMLGLSKSDQRMRGDRLAQSMLSQARGRAFSALVVGSVTPFYKQDEYEWKLEVGPVDGAQQSRLKSVKVTVQWKERDEIRQSVREVWVANVTR